MSGKKSARLFVDSQNFVQCFWPKDTNNKFELREVNWGRLTATILDQVGATAYDSLNYYEAFKGGALPKNPREYWPSFAQLVGKELEMNPKFVIKPGTLKINEFDVVTQKAVDTQIVVDMTRGALLGEYDVAVLFSGDLDMRPGVMEVLRSGRECVICGWKGRGLSYELKCLINESKNVLSYIDLTQLGTAFITRVAAVRKNIELSSGEFAAYLELADYHLCGETPVSAQKIVESNYYGMPYGVTNRYDFLDKLVVKNVIESDCYPIAPHANLRLVGGL
jgi:uncharacterized LabA/DUF88 family protein